MTFFTVKLTNDRACHRGQRAERIHFGQLPYLDGGTCTTSAFIDKHTDELVVPEGDAEGLQYLSTTSKREVQLAQRRKLGYVHWTSSVHGLVAVGFKEGRQDEEMRNVNVGERIRDRVRNTGICSAKVPVGISLEDPLELCTPTNQELVEVLSAGRRDSVVQEIAKTVLRQAMRDPGAAAG